ncbi:glutathione S-transferase N-terminal domain-containing protein [Candidatus Kaiserbacteria bacterium]|nr:glutathione S-transferase N-terminal domain-containing protein [Candidatus Kaiserbacteria bacterium]
MLTLYYKESCPFCQRVLQIAENLKVELDLRDVASDESQLAELIEKQGHGEVPYMFDTEKEVAIDESSDIIEYMRENYAQTASSRVSAAKPRIHVGGSVCESCEG